MKPVNFPQAHAAGSVTVLLADELRWSFKSQTPKVIYRGWRGTDVDPTPAYAHDVDLVRREAARLDRICPALDELEIRVMPWECTSRTNGFSDREHRRRTENDPPRWQADIVLSGKRIPIHPAMTRYLVAHEYGHQVEWWLERALGYWEPKDSGRMLREYSAFRGLTANSSYYGPGHWHADQTEVFADDFRILVAEREVEFWPHPGIPRPDGIQRLETWWAWAQALLWHSGRELAA